MPNHVRCSDPSIYASLCLATAAARTRAHLGGSDACKQVVDRERKPALICFSRRVISWVISHERAEFSLCSYQAAVQQAVFVRLALPVRFAAQSKWSATARLSSTAAASAHLCCLFASLTVRIISFMRTFRRGIANWSTITTGRRAFTGASCR